MPRIFIHHDQDGKIISIASVETIHDTLPHPFCLDDPQHGVIETSSDDPALAGGLQYAHDNARVDVATGRLIAPDAAAAKSRPPAGRRKRPQT
jgi:hypothetical protein